MNDATLRSIRAVAFLLVFIAIIGVIYCLYELNRIQGIYEDTVKESELAGAIVTPTFLARKSSLQMWLTLWIVVIVVAVIVDRFRYYFAKQLKQAELAPKCPHCLGDLPGDAQPAACRHCGRALAWFQNRPFSPEEARQRADYEQQREQREYLRGASEQQLRQEVASQRAAQRAREKAAEKHRRHESRAARKRKLATKWQRVWNAWKSLIGTDSNAMALTFWVVAVLFLGTIATLIMLILR